MLKGRAAGNLVGHKIEQEEKKTENRTELEEVVKDKDCSTKLDVNTWVNANELSQELLKNYQNKTLLQIELELKNRLEEKFRRVCDIFVKERSDRYVHVILAFDEARTMINTKAAQFLLAYEAASVACLQAFSVYSR